MTLIDEVFGDLDGYRDKDDFALLPDGAFVLAEVTAASGKTNKNGTAYCSLESRAVMLSDDLPEGNYGSPRFWDNANFATPAEPDPTATEEEAKKARGRFGAWVRRVRALGLEPKGTYDMDWTADELGAFYAPTVGRTVIIKTRLEPARESFKARNTARDYYPDTPENRAKHRLTVAVNSPVSFDPEKMEL